MPKELKIPDQVQFVGNESSEIAIVVSRYNDNITEKLLAGAIRTVQAAGFPDEQIVVVRVPGAWELGYATQIVLSNRHCRAAVALGAVIKGETTHDEHINRAVSMALMQLSLDYNKPVGLGLLTVNTLEQAIQRSGGNYGNKGEEAAQAVIDCLKVGEAYQALDNVQRMSATEA
jgi:6,7-dimethyl-8-ribityllumazine synthase